MPDRVVQFVDAETGAFEQSITTALTRGVVMVAHWKKKMIDKPHRMLRLAISSGDGEQQLRQAVIVSRAFETLDIAECPSLFAVEDGLRTLRHWISDRCPDRKDWKLMMETFVWWPPEMREDSDA